MPGGATGTNNINENPQFVDSGNLDFRLMETSPCIDAGIDVGLEYLGEAPDMGCYEYGPTIGQNDYQTNNLIIFPNPTDGKIKFEFGDDNPEPKGQQIKVSDLTGKIIIERPVIQQDETIDLSAFESGIYFINIQTDKKIITSKILKN